LRRARRPAPGRAKNSETGRNQVPAWSAVRTGRLTGSPACRRPPPPSSRSRISTVTPYTAAHRGAARRPPGHGAGKQCRENYDA
jgi:hypothetical protein